MRHLLSCLLFLTVFSLFIPPCEAVMVGPGLQAVLQAGPPDGEVPVIINLADKADIGQVPIVLTNNTRAGKALRRNAFATALKDKADKTQRPLRALLQSRNSRRIRSLWLTNSIAAIVPSSVISELMSVPEVESIELDAVVQAPGVTPAATGNPIWGISAINAPALWNAGISGSGAVVASLDTGVDVTHPDLKYRWRGGACSTPPDCPSWFDPYNLTTLPYGIPATARSLTPLDYTHAHGTHTMGTMVGGSASFQGYAIGVAPGARWISAKVFDDASGASTISTILSAFQWALAPAGDAANAPDVINNSWVIGSQNTCDTSVLTAISNLTAAGIEVVFAAGNVDPGPAPSSSSFSPANNPGVFAVGAVDNLSNIGSFSALGPSACDGLSGRPLRTTNFPNLVAPGVVNNITPPKEGGILSSVPEGGLYGDYWYLEGTSMAAPHASGTAALLAGAMPSLTPAQIEEALEESAMPLGSPLPNNTYGYGLLDAEAAYRYAFVHFGKGNVPQIAGVPSSVDFIGVSQGSTSEEFSINIVNQGTSDLTINPGGISFTGLDPDDFSITNDNCSGHTISSLSGCTVVITFSPGAAGSRSGRLTIDSNDTVTPVLNLPLDGNDPVALAQGASIVATYPDIQTAADNCSNWDTVEMQAGSFTENPDFNLPLGITVSLQGGYDTAFGSQTGFTTVQGTLTISSGVVIAGNVIVM
jgi:subtilisin family serine protease